MKRLSAVAVLALLAPAAAHAASEGIAGFAWEMANLLLLLGVLIYFARKPVMSYLGERRETIQSNIQASEKLLADSEARLAEWNEKAARLDADVESIKATARKAAEQEAEKIVSQAQASADRIRDNAQAVVERELNVAREHLREEAAKLAVDAAGRVLSEQVTDADRERLVDEFIQKIEGGAN